MPRVNCRRMIDPCRVDLLLLDNGGVVSRAEIVVMEQLIRP